MKIACKLHIILFIHGQSDDKQADTQTDSGHVKTSSLKVPNKCEHHEDSNKTNSEQQSIYI